MCEDALEGEKRNASGENVKMLKQTAANGF